MAVQQPGGANGGGGGSTTAVTRINTIDPHILIMMRDVMEATDTGTTRLNSTAGSGGGGGGGSAADNIGTTNNDATQGDPGTAQTRTIVSNDGAAGGKGNFGTKDTDPLLLIEGGGGGGGAGGNGGALVIISTTAAASMGTCQVNGGAAGSDGSNGANATPEPSAGNSGKLIQIQI